MIQDSYNFVFSLTNNYLQLIELLIFYMIQSYIHGGKASPKLFGFTYGY